MEMGQGIAAETETEQEIDYQEEEQVQETETQGNTEVNLDEAGDSTAARGEVTEVTEVTGYRQTVFCNDAWLFYRNLLTCWTKNDQGLHLGRQGFSSYHFSTINKSALAMHIGNSLQRHGWPETKTS